MAAGPVLDYERRWYATGTMSVLDVDDKFPEDNIEERIHEALRGAGITFNELIVVEQFPPDPR
jgi:hypothetical protein